MIVVGVTGAIGSGKTAVCKIWEDLGALVVYADDLAKELMVTDNGLRSDLKQVFGEKTYNEDGSLNRTHLVKEAFEKGRVQMLNDLVHPKVAQAFKEICRTALRQGREMVVEEAALLLNRGRPDIFDKIIIVKSDREKRIGRVTKRDRVAVEDVVARSDRQPDFDKLDHLADHIIENNGTLAELEKKAKQLFQELIQSENSI